MGTSCERRCSSQSKRVDQDEECRKPKNGCSEITIWLISSFGQWVSLFIRNSRPVLWAIKSHESQKSTSHRNQTRLPRSSIGSEFRHLTLLYSTLILSSPFSSQPTVFPMKSYGNYGRPSGLTCSIIPSIQRILSTRQHQSDRLRFQFTMTLRW